MKFFDLDVTLRPEASAMLGFIVIKLDYRICYSETHHLQYNICESNSKTRVDEIGFDISFVESVIKRPGFRRYLMLLYHSEILDSVLFISVHWVAAIK